jgi:hypothetical protein
MVKRFFICCPIIIIAAQDRLTYTQKSDKVHGNMFEFYS